ncbi:hypothetical protein [Lentzea flaviverrucosa]|nr:hypothetical protein [Lentzea flaviverrucosa]
MTLALANRDLGGIETLFLLADPTHTYVPSTLITATTSLLP